VICLKGVLYIRVSTREQNPENQLIVLRKFCEARGIEVVGFYEDQISGYETRPDEREGWQKAIELAEETRAAIIVFSLDRIARRYDYLVQSLDKLRTKGIQVIAYQEEWLTYLTMPYGS